MLGSWWLGWEKFRGGDGDKLVQRLQRTSGSFIEALPTLRTELLPLDRG